MITEKIDLDQKILLIEDNSNKPLSEYEEKIILYCNLFSVCFTGWVCKKMCDDILKSRVPLYESRCKSAFDDIPCFSSFMDIKMASAATSIIDKVEMAFALTISILSIVGVASLAYRKVKKLYE